MFPLAKLAKLPRHQRLRKICKMLQETENRLCTAETVNHSINTVNTGFFSAETCIFYADIALLLAQDPLFRPEAISAFSECAGALRLAAAGPTTGQIRRPLNTMRHILLAETGRSPADWDFIDSQGRLDAARRRPFPGMLAYLEDIRSPFNVGAMFRTAESFGVEKMILSPLCADPRHPRAERTAMGCVDVLPWERRDLFGEEGKTQVFAGPVFALETGGAPLGEFPFPRQGIMIAGSEELGVSPQALAAADASLGRVTIPCYGAKGSLNVSAAFGIVMQAWAAILQNGEAV